MRELLQKGKSPPLLVALNVWLVDFILDCSFRLAIQFLTAQIDHDISSSVSSYSKPYKLQFNCCMIKCYSLNSHSTNRI